MNSIPEVLRIRKAIISRVIVMSNAIVYDQALS